MTLPGQAMSRQKRPGVNRFRQAADAQKTTFDGRRAVRSRPAGKRIRGGLRFTAAVTLSSLSRNLGRKRQGLAKPAVHASMRKNREVVMKRFVWGFAALFGLAAPAQAQVKINPTDPQPTCQMCPGTYIPLSELEAYHEEGDRRKAARPAGAGYRYRQGPHRHRHGPSRQAGQASAGFGRRARPGQRGLSRAVGRGDAGARPRYRQPAAAARDHAHGRRIQRSRQQRIRHSGRHGLSRSRPATSS